MRQLVRHRTASLSEWSGRYTAMTDEFYVPEKSRLRKQNIANKQGSSQDSIDDDVANDILGSMEAEQNLVYSNYVAYLENNLAKEIARINIPLAIYTELYWKIDLHNLFHFLKLRNEEHAQEEIHHLAELMYQLIYPVVPISCQAYEDYVRDSIIFSSLEQSILKNLLQSQEYNFCEAFDQYRPKKMSNREVTEFKKKIELILKRKGNEL